MDKFSGNIFDPPNQSNDIEVFTSLFESDSIRIEKINGLRPYTKPGKWYDQADDEWVILLQGDAVIEFRDKKTVALQAGDFIFIPAHKAHRIKETSKTRNCLWLAIHGKLK